MRRTVLNLVLAACGLSAAVGAHAATLIGDTVQAVYLYPDTSSVYADLGAAVVGGSSPTFANVNNASVLNIDITGDQIVFNWIGAGASFLAPFDGVRFTDTTHPFTNAVLDGLTNTPGIVPGEVTLVGGSIFVDLNNAVYSPGQNITIDVNGPVRGGGGVPEPAAWALMLIGLGGVGAMVRRGRTAAMPVA